MPCAEFADMMLEYAGLARDERVRVDDHVAGCGECRELLQALRAVDAALSAWFSGQAVSADFEAVVRERVRRQASAPRLSRVPEVLDSLGWAAIVALIGSIVWWMVPRLPVAPENLAITFNMVWVAAVAFLFISFLVGLHSFLQLKH